MATEYEIQKEIVDFLDQALPVGSFYAHVPNGGYRRIREVAKLKRMGMKPGTPDLVVIVQDERASGRPLTIWFEVKSKTGKQTDEQLDVMTTLCALGSPCFMVNTPEQVEQALRCLGVALRATTGAENGTTKA